MGDDGRTTMDDHLRLESLSAATLRMLLVQERAHRQELEQEVLRLRASQGSGAPSLEPG